MFLLSSALNIQIDVGLQLQLFDQSDTNYCTSCTIRKNRTKSEMFWSARVDSSSW